jgi:hypothetical protein
VEKAAEFYERQHPPLNVGPIFPTRESRMKVAPGECQAGEK